MAIRSRLVGSLALYCNDAGVAEELAQEALLRAWRRWPEVSSYHDPEAWVWRTGFNLARSWFRRRGAEHRANRRAGAGEVSFELPDIPSALAVRAIVSTLPNRQRAALVARYYAGLSVEATAEALGCAPGTVKALTHQAVSRLRAELLETGDETIAHV